MTAWVFGSAAVDGPAPNSMTFPSLVHALKNNGPEWAVLDVAVHDADARREAARAARHLDVMRIVRRATRHGELRTRGSAQGSDGGEEQRRPENAGPAMPKHDDSHMSLHVSLRRA